MRGQIIERSIKQDGEERFWYDAAANRTTPDLPPVWDNLLKRLEGVRWEYDGFGRMTERHDSHRGTVQRFSYDDEHRISQVIIEGNAEFARAAYRYDALGRRTEKQVWRRHTRNAERTQYAWSGLQMVGECSDSYPDAAVQYIYTENSYEPLARVDSRGGHAEVYWYHTELNGLPEKVTDSSGDVVWQGISTTWGRSERENSNANWDVPQNLRFQGQYLDRETGLHYNTFRYYDPCGGRYTQMDPIGLLGGLNTYTYVVDPLGWVDPLGLARIGCYQPPERDVFYRSMSERDYNVLKTTGRMPGTTETTISPAREFAQNYDGILVKFSMKPGTTNALEKIGIRDNSSLTADTYPEMLSPAKTKGWGSQYARFKGEGEQINIALGREGGNALNIFNDGINSFEVLPK